MKKFKEFNLFTRSIIIYLLSILSSFILSPAFFWLYKIIFNPLRLGGGLFYLGGALADYIFSGFYLAYFFILPLFSFLFIDKKNWLVWIIGAIFPFSVALIGGGIKDTFWAIVLTIAGWALAKVILMIKDKTKKPAV